jgi:ubiquinone/menaquinone biosynthesis C-methylase UbiE
MERFQLRMLVNSSSDELKKNLGITLKYNPIVKWYFEKKCPESKEIVNQLVKNVPNDLDQDEVRKAELFVMDCSEDFVIYCYPHLMDTHCDFIRDWKKERLLELADFTNKIVLDIGSGSGRLTFAAATKAKHVYACEPVDSLREYLRDKIKRQNIKNVTVVDGMIDAIPYPNSMFDIVMSGHVWGDDYLGEYNEMVRVVKDGGYIIDCMGEESGPKKPDKELIKLGFEYHYYKSVHGGDVYRYIKQIKK